MTVSHLGAKKNVPAYSESSLLGQVKKDIEQDCLLSWTRESLFVFARFRGGGCHLTNMKTMQCYHLTTKILEKGATLQTIFQRKGD